jgi:hypothetical protein
MSIRGVSCELVGVEVREGSVWLLCDMAPSRDFCRSCSANLGCSLADLRIDWFMVKGVLVLLAIFIGGPPVLISLSG